MPALQPCIIKGDESADCWTGPGQQGTMQALPLRVWDASWIKQETDCISMTSASATVNPRMMLPDDPS
jgi:hypothetical protein